MEKIAKFKLNDIVIIDRENCADLGIVKECLTSCDEAGNLCFEYVVSEIAEKSGYKIGYDIDRREFLINETNLIRFPDLTEKEFIEGITLKAQSNPKYIFWGINRPRHIHESLETLMERAVYSARNGEQWKNSSPALRTIFTYPNREIIGQYVGV